MERSENSKTDFKSAGFYVTKSGMGISHVIGIESIGIKSLI